MIFELNKDKKMIKQKLEQQANEGRLSIEDAISYYKRYGTAESYSFLAIAYLGEANLKSAIKHLELGIKRFPVNYTLHYNLSYFYMLNQQWLPAVEYNYRAIRYAVTSEEKSEGEALLKEIVTRATAQGVSLEPRDLNQYASFINLNDCRVYPLQLNGVSGIRRPQQIGTSDEYMLNVYQSLDTLNVDVNSYPSEKTELVKGALQHKTKVFQTEHPIVLPISKVNDNATVIIYVNDSRYKFEPSDLQVNQFNYIRIEEVGMIEVRSDAPIFIGQPIELKLEETKPKLVLKIFVDGLSQQFLEDEGIEELMPHTARYFKEGTHFTNCYTTSEWTMPSKMSINTGVYSTKHMILHPSHFVELSKDIKMMAEYFKEDGYYTTYITPNWRTTPLLGYYRGFDRIIYQNFLGGFDGYQIVNEAIEHLSSYPEKNHFLSLSFLDLHNVPDQIQTHLYSQVKTDITQRLYKNDLGVTSVQTKYDESKVEKYRLEIQRMDTILSTLYSFLNEQYEDHEIIVAFHSDHGQSFLEDSFDLLSDNRLKIPLMLKGKNIPSKQYEGLTESVDILPTLLQLANISKSEMDGQAVQLEENRHRMFTMTQIIHPNQTYKALIKGVEEEYRIESEGEVQEDLSFELGEHFVETLPETESFVEKARYSIFENSKHLWR